MNRINLLPGAQRSAQLRRRRWVGAAVWGLVSGLVLVAISWVLLLWAQAHAHQAVRESEVQLSAWRVQYQHAVALQEQVHQATEWRQRLAQGVSGRSQPRHWFEALETSWPSAVKVHALRLNPQHLVVEGTARLAESNTALGEWVLSAGGESVPAEVMEVQMTRDIAREFSSDRSAQQFRIRWAWPAAASHDRSSTARGPTSQEPTR